MITRYGYDVFFTITAICVVLLFVVLAFFEPRTLRYVGVAVILVVWGFTINFFRDPERSTSSKPTAVISPADGKIIAIKTVAEPEYLQGEAKLISIFMSPLNVHVNRIPVSGTVEHLRYVKGEYFAAFEDKASEKNEQMIVGIAGTKGKVLFKQIAGFIARRIVCELSVGETVTAGKRFGMIKFGSRVDVFLPPDVNILVSVGTRTTAGETILAEFPE